MVEKITIQNEPTQLEKVLVSAEGLEVCQRVAENIFRRVMNWHPLDEAAKIAGDSLANKMRDATFFSDNYELTLKQKEYIQGIITSEMQLAAEQAIRKMKDYKEESEEHTETTVIEEMTKIPEMTMRAIGQNVNRGALLAMTAVQAKSTNDERDEIVMWKSKTTGDITIPTRGVFISTNCVEKIKQAINFRDIEINTNVE
jgi:hypothetical protein